MLPKEFNKYSLEELKALLGMFRELGRLADEFNAEIDKNPEKLFAELTAPYTWSSVYALPFLAHLTRLIHALGMNDLVVQALNEDDPNQFLIELFDMDLPEEWAGGTDGKFEKKDVFGLLYSLSRTIRSMEVHGKFINELIADMQHGNDKALFKAIQIDRTVTSCPPVADRITTAQIMRDEPFFKRLSKALSTQPNKPDAAYNELRFMLYALEDAGALDNLTLDREYRLFCEELQLYPIEGDDPVRSLHQLIWRWKTARST